MIIRENAFGKTKSVQKEGLKGFLRPDDTFFLFAGYIGLSRTVKVDIAWRKNFKSRASFKVSMIIFLLNSVTIFGIDQSRKIL